MLCRSRIFFLPLPAPTPCPLSDSPARLSLLLSLWLPVVSDTLWAAHDFYYALFAIFCRCVPKKKQKSNNNKHKFIFIIFHTLRRTHLHKHRHMCTYIRVCECVCEGVCNAAKRQRKWKTERRQRWTRAATDALAEAVKGHCQLPVPSSHLPPGSSSSSSISCHAPNVGQWQNVDFNVAVA